MNVTEQVIVLPLLPRNGSRNKLPVSSENPFLCTMELTGVEETAKGSVEMQKWNRNGNARKMKDEGEVTVKASES